MEYAEIKKEVDRAANAVENLVILCQEEDLLSNDDLADLIAMVDFIENLPGRMGV